jgi:dihydroxy-acid dehydratase
MPQLIEAVKRGVLEAGGLPFVFSAMSLGEILTNPTTMLFRNLMAMEVEEQLGNQPMDSVVLLGGCDKTVPAELMAAVSSDIPSIALVVGPMMTGNWRGERLGACTDCRRMWADYRGAGLDAEEIAEVTQQLCPTSGTCMVMGTASTMACVTEALGLMLPTGATAPAVSSDRLRLGVRTGREAVRLIGDPVTPREILSEDSFHNAMTVLSAIGGSTNAIIHLTAIARRMGIRLTLEDFDRVSAATPLLVDCKPAGKGYLPDMHIAGGVPALLAELKPLLRLDAKTVTGKTLGELIESATNDTRWQTTIRTLDEPLGDPGALVALKGSLAPEGAVLKVAAASGRFNTHRGPAAVFDSQEDLEARIDDESLGLTEDHVIVLRNIGPAAAGMPEAGSAPIPQYLAKQGVRDMVRISDGRMSGTSYGTVVLHVAPESSKGGPLSLVRDGDLIELDVERRVLDLLVDEQELARRTPSEPRAIGRERGYRKLYHDNVLQAPEGADLGFLVAD